MKTPYPMHMIGSMLLLTASTLAFAANNSAQNDKTTPNNKKSTSASASLTATDTTTTTLRPSGTTTTTLKPATTTTTTQRQISTTTTTTLPVKLSAASLFANMPGAITSIQVQNLGSTEQRYVPVTFAQVFKQGDVPANTSLYGKRSDNTLLAVQMDIKAKHPDGSVRHAVLTILHPGLTPGQTDTVGLVPNQNPPHDYPIMNPTDFANSGFSTKVAVNLNGVTYTASADELLRSTQPKTWLSGFYVAEWLVSAPLKNAAGVAHPHLSARFAVRAARDPSQGKVDVIVENDWAYEPNPQNFTYDVQVQVNGKVAYTKTALLHYHHARWRKSFSLGSDTKIHVKHLPSYLAATKAIPNYDLALVVPEASLAGLQSGWTGAKTEPMGVGAATPYMPMTGGRGDIGLLPNWTVLYLLSMDARAKQVTFGTGDLAGSWSMHYRNKNTDRPVSLFEYPYMTILGRPGDTYNPVTKKYESFPTCAVGASCTTPNDHDTSHQPSLAYVPYLLTGEHYYLEELQFWTMWNLFSSNPGYRQNIKALVSPDQVRGQAWTLRTLGQAAFITPDDDPLKSHFAYFADTNLDWFNTTYTNNATANIFGAIVNGYSLGYDNGRGLAPWQDDFFTAAIGYMKDLGFAKAQPLLAWKAKFPVGRMTAPGYCWIDGAIYSLNIRDSSTSPFYTSFAQAYQGSHTPEFNALACNSPAMATALGLKVGEMTGYSYSTMGYPSNMQPALAYSVNSGHPDAAKAWSIFMSRTVQPNYATDPQFAVVPR